jgi:hypothetical protein
MTAQQTSPAGCRTCAHHEPYTVVLSGSVETRARCLKHKPMHDPCGWHSDGALMRIDGNRTGRAS